jgi:amidase
MTADELPHLTIHELQARLRARALSPVDVTDAILRRIEQFDGRLHSYATVTADAARAQARRAESEIMAGNMRSPLHGVPLAVKDLCATKGVRTACGTAVLADRVPDYTATVVERLDAAGAVTLGKLQLTEGAFAEHHPTVAAPVNPWAAARWTGVSSSGSGVAVAAGLAYGALGTDTGGSIRFPCACNGIVGIKPTWGRVSRYGVFPLAASLDHVGPMTRCVRDAAAMLAIIAGADPRDSTTLADPVPDYTADLDRPIGGIRIGVDRAYCFDGTAPEVGAVVDEAIGVLRGLGAHLIEVTVPPYDALLTGWTPFTAVEAAIAHRATYPAQANAYGPALRSLLELGTALPAREYAHTQLARLAFTGALRRLFADIDLLVCPAMPLPPPTVEEVRTLAGAAEATAAILRFTAPFDFSGSPTISLPCGFTADGMPLGLQMVARHLDEPLLCRVGHAYEQATPWHERHPPPAA